jgi:hypothetical protein
MCKGNGLSSRAAGSNSKNSEWEQAKGSIQRQRPHSVIRKGLPESLPTSVQKSYFMLTDAEHDVLNIALEKYRPGQSVPILVGGKNLLKPASRLTSYIAWLSRRSGTTN